MHLFEYLLDVEEDLDLLDLTAAVNKVDGVNNETEIKFYKNKLNEANSKVEELEELVGKLRYNKSTQLARIKFIDSNLSLQKIEL